MNNQRIYPPVDHLFLIVLLILPLFAVADIQEFSMDESGDEENILVLDLDSAAYLALHNSDKLFEAKNGIRVASLLGALNRAEFDLGIYPRGDSGYIGGGSAGSGLTIGGGLNFEKKFSIGTQVSIEPALLKAADKYHSTLQARISQPLLRGFGREYNLAGIRLSEFAQRSAVRGFYKTMTQTVLGVIELMYEMAKLEELVKLNLASYQRQEIFWKSTKLKERIGLSNGLDVYRAEVELKNSLEVLNRSKESLEDVRDQFSHLLALPQETKFVVVVPFALSEEVWELEEATQLALEQRIEIDQALDQIDESRRLVKYSENDLMPDLNLVLDYSNLGYGEEFTGSFGRKRESQWGIGFTTSTDMCRTREKTAYERALMGVQSTKKALDDLKRTIALEVKRNLKNLARAKENIAQQKQNLKSLEAGVKLAKAKLLRQFATSFDVIQAEKAFHAAQTSFNAALIDHKITEYRLRAALGVLIENPFKKA